ncbi:MAG: cytochrome c oxidase subunit II, partial [Flavobacteriales bacterium]|nr:cytochrome c oxidase subunit II [Flavobacteriales bacterium]
MISFLIYAVIILGIIAIVQLARVFELTGELKGRKEWEISEKDNAMQANLYLWFGIILFVLFGWLVVEYGGRAQPNGSVHGVEYDFLLLINYLLVVFVFLVVNAVLFYFAWKYKRDPNRVPEYFTHSTKLEMIWTVVPSIVMAGIIIYGILFWYDTIMTKPGEDAIAIELYSKQFDWTARYGGADNQIGNANVRLIEGANFLGVDVEDPNSKDDKIVKGEFHLPVDREVAFQFRSQDVLHGAYMPNFRAQMNTVPGQMTFFHFTPNKTTQQQREELGDPDFNYVLMCNKICGASHYNMQMNI